MRLPVCLVIAGCSGLSFAQSQKPPIAQYWMSVDTAAGMSMPGMGAAGGMMSGMMGGQAAGGRRMLLQLGSQRPASGEPRAAHEIPPGMNMGAQLPLLTPRRERAERAPRDMPEGMEQPKGRMLLYWGCGESVRPGQPVVIDFAKLSQGQAPAGMVSRRVAQPSGPAFGRSRTYGDWPNPEDGKSVPESASLLGAHAIKGNYSPEIRFSLENDFLEKVDLNDRQGKLNWRAVPQATGYFAMLYGAQNDHEVVFWSSSEVQEMGGGLMDFVPPAEVARLIREKVVLPPSATECAVPGEVVKKAGTPMVSFVAYGPEANFAHPPRPKDPKAVWEPDWAVKVRFKSTASILMGEGGGERPARAERERPRETQSSQTPSAPDPVQEGVKEGIKALRGIFGR